MGCISSPVDILMPLNVPPCRNLFSTPSISMYQEVAGGVGGLSKR